MLLIHTKNANVLNRIRVSFHELAGLKSFVSGHRENTVRRLKVDKKAVQDLDQCLTEFECDPFDLSNKVLRTLIAGQVASAVLQSDFENAQSWSILS